MEVWNDEIPQTPAPVKKSTTDTTATAAAVARPTKCKGCFPLYQPNQMAHMDPGGCLYVSLDDDFLDSEVDDDDTAAPKVTKPTAPYATPIICPVLTFDALAPCRPRLKRPRSGRAVLRWQDGEDEEKQEKQEDEETGDPPLKTVVRELYKVVDRLSTEVRDLREAMASLSRTSDANPSIA